VAVFENISILCRKNKISIAKLERDTGLGNATVRGWARSSPTVDKLKAVADYFGVTVDELLREDEPTVGKETT
jgi:transcriptional regulator with XRE-family HTH domain